MTELHRHQTRRQSSGSSSVDDRSTAEGPANEVGRGMSAETPAEIRVRTGARLHFGLLDTVAPFGGVGVMVEEPATEVRITPALSFGCDATLRGQVEPIARRIAERRGDAELPRCQVSLVGRPPRHSGFGSGTQFSLAVAESLCRHLGSRVSTGSKLDGGSLSRAEFACRIAGRGTRSAVGIHGYFAGGLVYEVSDGASSLNPVFCRVELPEAWRIALFLPRDARAAVSGEVERSHFAQLAPASTARRNELREQLEQRVLPAADEADFDRFADGVATYNRLSGELFAPVQGGAYHGGRVADLVAWLQDRGADGVGQSSWGPGVFAWFATAETAERFLARLPAGPYDVRLTTVRNRPRELTTRETASGRFFSF